MVSASCPQRRRAGARREAGDVGGIGATPPGTPSQWLPYVAVADVDATAKRVPMLGGTIHVPPTDIPNIGRFCVLADPTGATIAIYRSA